MIAVISVSVDVSLKRRTSAAVEHQRQPMFVKLRKQVHAAVRENAGIFYFYCIYLFICAK